MDQITITISVSGKSFDLIIDKNQKVIEAFRILVNTNRISSAEVEGRDFVLSVLNNRQISVHKTFLDEAINTGDVLKI